MIKTDNSSWYIVLCILLFVCMQAWYAYLIPVRVASPPERSTGEIVPPVDFDSPVKVQSEVPDMEPKIITKTVVKTVYILPKVKHHHVKPKMIPILPTPPVVVPEKTYSVFCRTQGNIKIPSTRQKSCQSVEIVAGRVKWY